MYAKKLIADGIAESRAYGLAAALNNLHTELCKLDLKNLRLFLKGGVHGQLTSFAEHEDLRAVVYEDFLERVQRSYTMFDTDEIDFTDWYERVGHAVDDLIELQVPGAGMVRASLNHMYDHYLQEFPPQPEPEVEVVLDKGVRTTVEAVTECVIPPLESPEERHAAVLKLKTEIMETFTQYEEGLTADFECVARLAGLILTAHCQLPEPPVSPLP